MIITIVATLIALGVLVTIHEAGHFLMARKLGVGVEKFSLGFGPKIYGKKIGDTEYLISALPLGGYVKLLGEDPKEECSDPKHSFSAQPVWKRFFIVFTGPVSNLILPIIIFGITFMGGVTRYGTVVGEVMDDSPALSSGLLTGDKIITINNESVTKWEDIQLTVSKNANVPLEFTINRPDTESPITLTITPRSEKYKNIFGEEKEAGRIGIAPGDETIIEKYNPLMAMVKGAESTWYITKVMFITIGKIIQGNISTDELGGPIRIGKMAGDHAKMGIIPYLNFIAMLSINLGILNLLPIPILDGGHIFFYLIEAIAGKPVSEKKMEMAQQIGMFLLISLMVFVTFNDIISLFKPGK